jgi:hypothetical protein
VEIGEPDAFGSQAVQVGRLDHRIAVTGQIAVSLIIRDDDHHVGLIRGNGDSGDRPKSSDHE